MTNLVDGTVPVAADFNGNFTGLNNAIGASTAISGYTTGDTLYASATNTLAKLAIAGNGQVIGAVGGIPAWSGHLQTTASRLTFSSTTAIQLGVGVIPLKVGSNWTLRPVTAAITVSNATLAASTTYFVYAYDNAGVTTLDTPSATGHSADTVWGVETKTGDATRTLVGMVRTNASSQFEDDNSLRGVLSYYNRRAIGLVNNFTANRTTTSGTYVELNSEIRGNFLTWGDEAVSISTAGVFQMNSTGNSGFTAFGIDGTNQENGVVVINSGGSAPIIGAVGLNLVKNGLSEGFHYVTLLGATTAAQTGTWFGATYTADTTARSITSLSVRIRG